MYYYIFWVFFFFLGIFIETQFWLESYDAYDVELGFWLKRKFELGIVVLHQKERKRKKRVKRKKFFF